MPSSADLNSGRDEKSKRHVEQYRYRDLSGSGSIRLLKLLPTTAETDGVVCELHETNLDGAIPEYEALSWCWGEGPWDGTILVRNEGQHSFTNVPRSFVSALQALRLPRGDRVLWVDAVCIDQKQDKDKSRQLRMMSRIYSSATRVCVWLGDGDDDSKKALEFASSCIRRLEDFDKLCEEKGTGSKWTALLKLIHRPWFSRRWVIQEIAMAKEALIYCGQDSIPWRDFGEVVALFAEVELAVHRLGKVMKTHRDFRREPEWRDFMDHLSVDHLVSVVNRLFRITRDGEREPLLSLEDLVSSLPSFLATEPQDTIYALLAIAKDARLFTGVGLQSQALITPSQERLSTWPTRDKQNFVNVFKEFIHFSILQSDKTRALDIICRTWAPAAKVKTSYTARQEGDGFLAKCSAAEAELLQLPSWIPRLDSAAHGICTYSNSESWVGRRNADPLVGLPNITPRNYSAAGGRSVDLQHLRFRKREKYYSMTISGFQLDRIARVEVASQQGNIPEEWFRQGNYEDSSKDPPEEFWRTLVADRGRNGRNPPVYYARACRESIREDLTRGSLDTTSLIDDGRCSVVADFCRRVQAAIWNRCLMRTHAGNLGIVRKEARKDDLVCILYGCSVPVILRRHRKAPGDLAGERKEDEQELKERKRTAAESIQRVWRKRLARRKDLANAKDLERGTREGRYVLQDTDQRRQSLRAQGKEASAMASGTMENIPRLEAAIKPKRATLPNFARSEMSQSHFHPSEDIPGDPYPLQAPNSRVSINDTTLSDTPDDFYYELIGECYVHGMMDGEAIKYQNDHNIKAQVFELR